VVESTETCQPTLPAASAVSVSDGLCTEVADETEVTDVVRRLGKEHRNVNTDERDERDDRLDWAVAAG
jgi:hypothetical protein